MRDRIEALRIVTGCASVDELIDEWEPFVDGKTLFVPHNHVRPVGTEVAFSLRLADKTPVLRGAGIVADAWHDDANPFGRSGMRVAISRIAPQSRGVFARLAPRQRDTQSVPITALAEKTVRAAVHARHLQTEREEPLPKRASRPALASVRGMRPITRPTRPVTDVPVLVADHGSSTAIAVGVAPLLWRWWFGVVAFALAVAMVLGHARCTL
jgi:hypothetical protein